MNVYIIYILQVQCAWIELEVWEQDPTPKSRLASPQKPGAKGKAAAASIKQKGAAGKALKSPLEHREVKEGPPAIPPALQVPCKSPSWILLRSVMVGCGQTWS